jgi:hypothetical protein
VTTCINTIFRSSWYHFSFKIIYWRPFILSLAFSPRLPNFINFRTKGFQSHHNVIHRHRPKSSTTFRGILIKILYFHSQVKKFQNDIHFICKLRQFRKLWRHVNKHSTFFKRVNKNTPRRVFLHRLQMVQKINLIFSENIVQN